MKATTFQVSTEIRPPIPSLNISGAVTYRFSSAPGRADIIYELEPAVEGAPQQVIAFAMSLWVATAVHHAHPAARSATFLLNRAVPAPLLSIAEAFITMTGFDLQIAPTTPITATGPTGDVFLVSGGKDTLFALEREARRDSLDKKPAVYLVGGAELGWPSEIEVVQRLCARYGLKLNVFRLSSMGETGELALKFGPRATWRELVTISLARQFGDRIITGINDDAIFRAQPKLHGPVIHLSQLKVSVSALARALNATIVTVPGEFEIYRTIRGHKYFDPSGSCLKPDDCVEDALCNKCRVFNVYNAVIDGIPLDHNQREFIFSNDYIGDAAIRDALRFGRLKCA